MGGRAPSLPEGGPGVGRGPSLVLQAFGEYAGETLVRRRSCLGGAAQAQARARAGGGGWERFLVPGPEQQAATAAGASAQGKAPLAALAPAEGKENSVGAAPLLAG